MYTRMYMCMYIDICIYICICICIWYSVYVYVYIHYIKSTKAGNIIMRGWGVSSVWGGEFLGDFLEVPKNWRSRFLERAQQRIASF